jgi:sugar phosphate isomerase/epimerase
MRTCINGATTMPYSLEKDVEAAGEAGFQGVEIWKTKLDEFLATNKKEAMFGVLNLNSRKSSKKLKDTLRSQLL